MNQLGIKTPNWSLGEFSLKLINLTVPDEINVLKDDDAVDR
jgi:hypothetical protein